MRRVCAWCGVEFGTEDSEPNTITHGICKECMDKMDTILDDSNDNTERELLKQDRSH